MYEVIQNVIRTGRFELTDLLVKIDTQWIQGMLSDQQRVELIEAARNKAGVNHSVDVIAKIAELEQRIRALEGAAPVAGDYPPYEAGRWYYSGDKVTFEGVRFVCTAASGSVCTWSPIEFPDFWDEA